MNRLVIAALLLCVGAPVFGSDRVRIPLDYDASLTAQEFPNPAVRAEVNGRTAWFLVDTGAGTHVMATWFVTAAGLAASLTELDAALEDSTAESIAVKGLRDLTIELPGRRRMALPVVAVIDYPPDFERAGIGGIISPQVLAGPARAAAIDLRVPELVFEPFDEAVRRLGAAVLDRDRVEFCGSLDDDIPNLLFALGVDVGARTGAMLPDSGAAVTRVVSSSVLIEGRSQESGGTTTGLAGKPLPYAVVRRLPLKFGGMAFAPDVRVVTMRGGCGRDGALGLDVLRACALVLSSTKVAVRCGP